MAKRYQSPRGTQDILPDAIPTWRTLEATFAEMARRYAYEEIRTPTFEEKELFVRSSGDTSEVVQKQMYDFLDKSGNPMALKPEETAPAVRAYLQHGLADRRPICRLWYATSVFRYERPAKGRLREPHQFGLEALGGSQPEIDAEVIELTVDFYRAIGLGNVKVLLNSIGREATRASFVEALLAHMSPWLADQSEEAKAKALRNPLRLLDTKDEATQRALEGGPDIQDHLEDSAKARQDRLVELLSEAEVPFVIEPRIVRGLDYYTDTVFEVETDDPGLGAQSALCGGGRYDDLVEEMGGKPTPAVGVGIGVERAVLVLSEIGKTQPVAPLDVFLVVATPDAKDRVRQLARELRSAGLSAQLDVEGRSMKSQMKQAAKYAARWTLIVGEDELAAHEATLRDMSASEQRSVPFDRVVAELTG